MKQPVFDWKSISLLLLSLFCLSGALLAQEDEAAAAKSFGAWDADGDGSLTREEWNDAFTANTEFDTWDADKDGLVNEIEVESVFETFDGRWDENEDGTLTVDEISEGLFQAYDLDSNEELGEGEFSAFNDAMDEAGLWEA